MTVYVVAQLAFKDRPAYDRYQAQFMGVFRNFNGALLAADEAPKLLEGASSTEKIVLMSFPDEASARRFVDSPEYQAIAVDRKRGADTVVFLVSGLSAPRAPGP